MLLWYYVQYIERSESAEYRHPRKWYVFGLQILFAAYLQNDIVLNTNNIRHVMQALRKDYLQCAKRSIPSHIVVKSAHICSGKYCYITLYTSTTSSMVLLFHYPCTHECKTYSSKGPVNITTWNGRCKKQHGKPKYCLHLHVRYCSNHCTRGVSGVNYGILRCLNFLYKIHLVEDLASLKSCAWSRLSNLRLCLEMLTGVKDMVTARNIWYMCIQPRRNMIRKHDN